MCVSSEIPFDWKILKIGSVNTIYSFIKIWFNGTLKGAPYYIDEQVLRIFFTYLLAYFTEKLSFIVNDRTFRQKLIEIQTTVPHKIKLRYMLLLAI